jgi:hypothetical protein
VVLVLVHRLLERLARLMERKGENPNAQLPA